MEAIGGLQDQNGPPGPNFTGDPKLDNGPIFHLHGLDPLRGSRTINILASPKLQRRSWVMNLAPKGSQIFTLEALRGAIIWLWPHFLEVILFYLEWTDSDVLNLLLAYFLVMSSKPTELTEYFPSATPPSVLFGFGILSQLASPSMASSGNFDPSQTYDCYNTVEVLDPACTECLAKACGRPLYSSSEVPISRINTDSIVKRIKRISDYTPDPDAEGSDELDGEEVEVVAHSVGHLSSTPSSQPLANRFHAHIIPSTPRTFQPTLAAIPTSLPPA
ncbi:hypothetical protein O181_049960 [Austropuccinia psidii MF-1]|uniref:Uncharacterized protein n=1 Tax=Austropuccinia psidii MF-1 TaxID=1389203 RepID=A0A9Q3E069_9BASI|nr:hypothetical protein [Austropuccinia psidii MF-1]